MANAETNMQGDPWTGQPLAAKHPTMISGKTDTRGGKAGQSPERGPDLTVPLEQELQYTLHVQAVKDQRATSITNAFHMADTKAEIWPLQ